MLNRIPIVLVAFCLSLTVFVWSENEIAPSFQSCVTQNTNQQRAHSSDENSQVIAGLFKAQLVCSLRLIDRHNGFFAALAAIVVSAFTFTLWIATNRLGNAAERQITEAEELRKIAEQQTILIRIQADILEKHKEISRLQVIKEHRPRLIVRNIIIANRTVAGTFFSGIHLDGRCFVQNTGGMSTTIIESHLEIYGSQMGLPMESPYERKPPNNVISGKFNIGESRAFVFSCMSPFANDDEANRGRLGEFPFFVLGWIHYRDDTAQGVMEGVSYRLAFCRRWDAGKRRFVREENDPDYEHDG